MTQPEVLEQPRALPRWSGTMEDWPFRLAAFVVALLLPTLLVALAGKDPGAVYREFVTGLTWSRFGDAATVGAILALCTASAMLTFAASLWNIGIEGELAVGTIGATAVVLILGGAPGIVLLPLMMLASAAAGAVWALLIAAMKLRGIHEIFSGFGLNQIAGALVIYMLLGPWRAISASRLSGIPFPSNAAFPRIGPINIWVILVSLLILGAVVFALARTGIGLRIRAVGLAPVAASYYQISVNRVFFLTLLVSGAIAGLGGTFITAGYFNRFTPGVTQGLGFTAILIYLIMRMNPLGVVLISLLFGIINVGTIGLQVRLGVDPSLASVIQSSLIVALFVLRRR